MSETESVGPPEALQILEGLGGTERALALTLSEVGNRGEGLSREERRSDLG